MQKEFKNQVDQKGGKLLSKKSKTNAVGRTYARGGGREQSAKERPYMHTSGIANPVELHRRARLTGVKYA